MSDFNIYSPGDIFDSREVIERIEELTAEWAEATGDEPEDYSLSEDDWAHGLSADDAAELVALLALKEDGETNTEDWSYGVTFISDDYFETYAQELAEDIGAIDREASWPAYHIDWEAAARDLQQDYTEIDVNGSTYWAR